MKIKSNIQLRVRIMSFNHGSLISGCRQLTDALESVPFTSSSIVTLPTNKRIYCVLRSPHVDKDSREHFEIRMHRRTVDIKHDPEHNIVQLIGSLNLPPGVFYKMKLP